MQELKVMAEIAHAILNNEEKDEQTNYGSGKKIIKSFFGGKKGNLESITARLIIIDSLYSTQINSKRLFGIEDLAKEIHNISSGSDKILIKISQEFLSKDLHHYLFDNLLKKDEGYGITKSGENSGQAVSLISKYLHFLLENKFPIYDTHAIKSYQKLKLKYSLNIPDLKDSADISYFKNLRELNEESYINNFEHLDNLLWLLGKFTDGSFSIVLSKPNYIKLVEKADIKAKIDKINNENKGRDKKNKVDNNSDKLIREYYKESKNIQNVIANESIVKFFNFAMSF